MIICKNSHVYSELLPIDLQEAAHYFMKCYISVLFLSLSVAVTGGRGREQALGACALLGIDLSWVRSVT